MRYSIEGFSQEKLIEFDLDLKDVIILRYIVDFINSNTMKKVYVDNKPFYWLKYEALQKDLPILKIENKNVLRRRLRKLEEKGILVHYHMLAGGSFSYYALGENFESLLNKNNINSAKKEDTTEKEGTEIDKVIDDYTENTELKKSIKEFIKFRKSIRATVTTFSLRKILLKLSALASLDEEKIQIIDNSLINGWKTLIPIKNFKQCSDNSINRFNNFTPRDYDYEKLERQLLGYE